MLVLNILVWVVSRLMIPPQGMLIPVLRILGRRESTSR